MAKIVVQENREGRTKQDYIVKQKGRQTFEGSQDFQKEDWVSSNSYEVKCNMLDQKVRDAATVDCKRNGTVYISFLKAKTLILTVDSFHIWNQKFTA